jgi:hypothetical protein
MIGKGGKGGSGKEKQKNTKERKENYAKIEEDNKRRKDVEAGGHKREAAGPCRAYHGDDPPLPPHDNGVFRQPNSTTSRANRACRVQSLSCTHMSDPNDQMHENRNVWSFTESRTSAMVVQPPHFPRAMHSPTAWQDGSHSAMRN